MAWTSPMTWVDDSVLTAAQLNLHLRDNFLETIVAKTTATSTFTVVDAAGHLVERTPGSALVNLAENGTEDEYVDLTTAGPSITRECGRAVFVAWGCNMVLNGTIGFVSVEVTRLGSGDDDTGEEGDVVLDPDDTHALIKKGNANPQAFQGSQHMMLHNLGGDEDETEVESDQASGTYTFTMKYRSQNGTTEFNSRSIFVWPLG